MNRLNPSDPAVLLCARACELSYKEFGGREFNAGVAALGFKDYATFEKAGIEVYCMSDSKCIVVCFRGTDSKPDWLANAMTTKTAMHNPEWRVHTGFLRTVMVIEQEVRGYCLERLIGSDRALYVTGHSQGAANAILFSMRWFKDRVSGVVTFGSPRVGNEAFARAYNAVHAKHSLRFVNNNDSVCRVPWKCLGYSHVFRQQRFDSRGRLHSDYYPSWCWKLWDNIAGRIINLFKLKFGDGITDHSITDYIKLVGRVYCAPPAPEKTV